MGTRADFYVGNDKSAEWIGSIAYDGYTDGYVKDFKVCKAKTEKKFRKRVRKMFKAVDHATRPEDGWPWPWADSRTTDYAYMFDGEKVCIYNFGRAYVSVVDDSGPELDIFPDMTAVQNVTFSGSGVMVMRVPPDD